jgi:uncharacterized Zn-finger protein
MRDNEEVHDKGNDVFCKGCGETLTNFLREMEEHNAKIACPHCGKVYDHSDATAHEHGLPAEGGSH